VNNFEFAANSIYQQNEFRSHLRGDPDTGRDVFITILTNPINKHFQRYGQNITVDMQRKVQVFGAEIVMRVLFGQFMIDIGGPLKISCTCQEYYPCLSLLSNFFPSTLLENVMVALLNFWDCKDGCKSTVRFPRVIILHTYQIYDPDYDFNFTPSQNLVYRTCAIVFYNGGGEDHIENGVYHYKIHQ